MHFYHSKPENIQAFQWNGTAKQLKEELPQINWQKFRLVDANGDVTNQTLADKNPVFQHQIKGHNTIVIDHGDEPLELVIQNDFICYTGSQYFALPVDQFKAKYEKW